MSGSISVKIGTNGPNTITADAGKSLIAFGRDGNDNLVGGARRDLLFGGEGNDVIGGGAGNDLLFGGAGNNTLSGGEGEDTVSWLDVTPRDVPGNASPVVLNLSDGIRRWGYEADGVAVDFLVFPGTAVHAGLEVDKLSDIERYQGSFLQGDVAFLESGFEEVEGASEAGYTAYSNGIETIWLRGFEMVLIPDLG
jgi:Ca2+-binding RTX toxin-like protein